MIAAGLGKTSIPESAGADHGVQIAEHAVRQDVRPGPKFADQEEIAGDLRERSARLVEYAATGTVVTNDDPPADGEAAAAAQRVGSVVDLQGADVGAEIVKSDCAAAAALDKVSRPGIADDFLPVVDEHLPAAAEIVGSAGAGEIAQDQQ